MKAKNSLGRWGPTVGVVAAGVFACSLTLQGAPSEKSPHVRHVGQTGTVSGTTGRILIGTGVPRDASLRVLPPVVVDYRNDAATRARMGGEPVAVGGGRDRLNRSTDVSVGGVAFDALAVCALDEQCNDCDPCTEDSCDPTNEAADPETGCVNRLYEADEPAPECDDGIFCNGQEVCIEDVCAQDPAQPCDDEPGTVCDEQDADCVTPCTTGTDCDDGNGCTANDRCEDGVCVGDPVDCGIGGNCFDNPPGTANCTTGRCCSGDPVTCDDTLTRDECVADSGMWLGVDDCDCPKYSSGVIDGSTTYWDWPFGAPVAGSVAVGPVSELADPPCSDALRTIGDDYRLENADTEAFMSIEMFRFVRAVHAGVSARFAIELRTSTGVLVEDTFFPVGVNAIGGPFVSTVVFDPPLVAPTDGIISISVSEEFGLDGRVYWFSTDGVDVGDDPLANDPSKMYVNGSIVSSNFLGQCNGGDRDGLWCEINGPTGVGCPGEPAGTCEDIPDILAFEIVASKTGTPEGACCDVVGGACIHELPWDCLDAGNIFKGPGTVCGVCTAGENPGIPCDEAADCGAGGVCDDQVCNNEFTTHCETSADCPPGGTCLNLVTTCSTKACCDDTDPDALCTEVVGTGTPCPPGSSSLGFGTSCEPNCCEQAGASTAGDNCGAVTPHQFNVPVAGTVEKVTLTGNNSGATFDDFNSDPQWCNSDAFDPAGVTRDPGWWEAFSIDDCAYVRLELCCSDPVVQPAWANLYTGCPCETILQNVGVPVPIGDPSGGVQGGARGLPFCEYGDDNLWQTFGPLAAGVYYYPIYSAPDGTYGVLPGETPPGGGDYQLNMYVSGCQIGACCYLGCTENPSQTCVTDDDCTGTCEPVCAELNVLDCQDRSGNWLSNAVSCDHNPETGTCATGACCTGPGQCADSEDVPGDMDKITCDGQSGRYVGGATCEDDPRPCPVCEFEDEQHCQLPDDTWFTVADYFPPYETVIRLADDFVATAEQLGKICLMGGWVETANDWIDCACLDDSHESDCPTEVAHNFQVTLYENDGGLPGAVVGTRNVTGDDVERGIEILGDPFDRWRISLVFDDDPILLAQGNTYWLEVYNLTDSPAGNVCEFVWNLNFSGNLWSVMDYDGAWHEPDWDDHPDTGDPHDMMFCLDQPLIQPDAATGACCLCGTDCIPDQTMLECQDLAGIWTLGQPCSEVTCPSVPAINDDCDDRLVVTDATYGFNNICSTTDGPTPIQCFEEHNPTIGNDIWYEYHTGSCEGNLTVDLCDIQNFDGVVALYSDGTDICPCPSDDTLIVECEDDACGNPLGPQRSGLVSLTEYVYPNQCYTVQLSGFALPFDAEDPAHTGPDAADAGFGEISFSCAAGCMVPEAPVAEPTVPASDCGTRNRYLSFSGGTPGAVEAARVTWTTGVLAGTQMWVGEPFLASESSGDSGGPDAVPPAPPPYFWAAELQCEPYGTDWSIYPSIHVFHDAIGPSRTYEVQFVDARQQDCIDNEAEYSPGLSISTSLWGDLVGVFDGDNCVTMYNGYVDCWMLPDCDADFDDISALVDKFKNLPGAPHKSRADIAPMAPDQVVDFIDIPWEVDAFRSLPYPWPKVADPCAR